MTGPSDAVDECDTLSDGMSRLTIVLTTIGLEGALIVMALLIGPLVDISPLNLIRWEMGAALWGVAVAAVVFTAVAFCLESDARFFRGLTELVEEVVQRLFSRCTLTDLFVISTLAGFGEELLFRGVMQRALTPVVGWGAALLVASAVFGAAHFVSLAYFWYATAFGIIAGVLFVTTDNLLAPMMAHAVYDFLALAYLVTRGRSQLPVHHGETGAIETPTLPTDP